MSPPPGPPILPSRRGGAPAFLLPVPPSSLPHSSAFKFYEFVRPTSTPRARVEPANTAFPALPWRQPGQCPRPYLYDWGGTARLCGCAVLPSSGLSLLPRSFPPPHLTFHEACTLPGLLGARQHCSPGSAMAATRTVSPPLLIRLGWHSPLCGCAVLPSSGPSLIPRSIPPPHLISGIHAPYQAREEPVSTAFPALPRRQPGQCPRPYLYDWGGTARV